MKSNKKQFSGDTPRWSDAQEFNLIKRFVAACRQQWPGAKIVLRPDGAPTGANTPIQLETGHQEK
jgi:hypothetical protein